MAMRKLKSRQGFVELICSLFLAATLLIWLSPFILAAAVTFCETSTDPSVVRQYKEFKLRNFTRRVEEISADLESLRQIEKTAPNSVVLLEKISREYGLLRDNKNGHPAAKIPSLKEVVIHLERELVTASSTKAALEKELAALNPKK